MIVSRQVDLLEPIDLAEHLGKVELYLGQVCQIAGISKMQLDYWTNKAQIPTKGKKQRIYDIDALETVMLIKQAKDKGLNLGAAIDAARRFRESASHGSPARSRTRALVASRILAAASSGGSGVDEDAGAELEPGQDVQPREEHEPPVVFAVLEPGVQRHLTLEPLQPAHEVGESFERGPQQRAGQRVGVGLDGCDHGLVGHAARPRAAARRLRRCSSTSSPARPWPPGAGSGNQIELRVGVRETRAGFAPFVDAVGTRCRARPPHAAATPPLRARARRPRASAIERMCRRLCTTTSCRSSAG